VAFGMFLREASGAGRDALVARLSLIVKQPAPVDTEQGRIRVGAACELYYWTGITAAFWQMCLRWVTGCNTEQSKTSNCDVIVCSVSKTSRHCDGWPRRLSKSGCCLSLRQRQVTFFLLQKEAIVRETLIGHDPGTSNACSSIRVLGGAEGLQ
jgi:hypothetical protein